MTHPRVWKHAFVIHRIDFVFAQVRYDTLVAEPLATGLAVEADCLARVQHAVVRVATSGQPAVLTPTCRTVACNGGEPRRAGCEGAAPRALLSCTSGCRRPRFLVKQKIVTVRADHDTGHQLRTPHRWHYGPTAALATSRSSSNSTTHRVASEKFSDLFSGRAVRDRLQQAPQ